MKKEEQKSCICQIVTLITAITLLPSCTTGAKMYGNRKDFNLVRSEEYSVAAKRGDLNAQDEEIRKLTKEIEMISRRVPALIKQLDRVVLNSTPDNPSKSVYGLMKKTGKLGYIESSAHLKYMLRLVKEEALKNTKEIETLLQQAMQP